MPSFQDPFLEAIQRIEGSLRRGTIRGHAQLNLLIARVKVIVLNSANSPVTSQAQPISDDVVQSINVITNSDALLSQNASAATTPSSNLPDPRRIDDIVSGETEILNHTHDVLRPIVLRSGISNAASLLEEEAEAKERDKKQASATLRRASQSSFAHSLTRDHDTTEFDLLSMDNHEENVIKLECRRFSNGNSIRHKLMDIYRLQFPGKFVAFKLWYEFPGSPGGINDRFWRMGEQRKKIPSGHSRLYFVNVALPDGKPGVRQYTVVTVSLNKHEKPHPVDLPASGNVNCCEPSCKDVHEHLTRIWRCQPWTIDSVQFLGAEAEDWLLTVGSFNDDTLAPDENTLYVVASPSPPPNVV